MATPVFPTDTHARVADAIAHTFATDDAVDTILITNSCARGRATPESDLDLVLLATAGLSALAVAGLEARWAAFLAHDSAVQEFRNTGPFAHVHADVITGVYTPNVWDDGGGPDAFELEIGNHIAHSAPLTEPGPHLTALRARWLPYYDMDLRAARLAMVRDACQYDLEHVPFFLRRDLPFQAFDRLYKAQQEFLQALFIAQGRYPLAYNKWIHEQVVEWLGRPDLYERLSGLLSLANSEAISTHARRLQALTEELQ